MKLAIDAVYKDGAFHPTMPPALPLTDGQHVRLTVEEEASSEMIGLLTDVYAGLPDDEIDAIEKIAPDRRAFFREQGVE